MFDTALMYNAYYLCLNKTFCMNFKEVLQNHEQVPVPCDKSTNLQDKYKPVKSRLVPKTIAA